MRLDRPAGAVRARELKSAIEAQTKTIMATIRALRDGKRRRMSNSVQNVSAKVAKPESRTLLL